MLFGSNLHFATIKTSLYHITLLFSCIKRNYGVYLCACKKKKNFFLESSWVYSKKKTLFIAFIRMKYLIRFLLFSSTTKTSCIRCTLYARSIPCRKWKAANNFYTQKVQSHAQICITANQRERYNYKRTMASLEICWRIWYSKLCELMHESFQYLDNNVLICSFLNSLLLK